MMMDSAKVIYSIARQWWRAACWDCGLLLSSSSWWTRRALVGQLSTFWPQTRNFDYTKWCRLLLQIAIIPVELRSHASAGINSRGRQSSSSATGIQFCCVVPRKTLSRRGLLGWKLLLNVFIKRLRINFQQLQIAINTVVVLVVYPPIQYPEDVDSGNVFRPVFSPWRTEWMGFNLDKNKIILN